MFLDDTACNLASINLMKFRREDGTFDVERFTGGLPHLLHRAGNPGRSRQLSDQANRREQPPVPPAGLGLLEPGQPDHGRRRAVRSRRGPRLVRRDDGPAARRGQSDQRRTGGRRRSVRRLFEQNREPMLRVMQMHRDAVEKIDDACPAYLQDAARELWDEVLDERPQLRLPQCPGHGARADRHDQLPDGLRHHRHRARHRPGEVQATGRRRHAEDRQPHRAAGAEDAGLRSAARSSRSWPTSKSTTRSKAPPDLQAEHLAVFDCAFKPRNGTRSIAWHAHVHDDGRRPAVPVRRDLQNGEHAARNARRPTSPTPTSKAGGWA